MAPKTTFFPGGILAMTAETADRLLSAGDGDAALLYLRLLRADGGDRAGARKALGWTEERVFSAWKTLEKLGLVDPEAPAEAPQKLEADEPPEYTAADLARELEQAGSAFPLLVGEAQKSLGKVLSTADLKMLYTIYDHLALPAEVILMLVHHCVRQTEEKYGAGRKPRMSQIKREAYQWSRAGADTAEAADAYLRRLDTLRDRESRLLPLLGIRGRGAVEGERKYLTAWCDWGFEDETVALAYERTVLRKGSMNWAYMNSILRNWHAAGMHTVAQVETGESKSRTSPGRQTGPSPAPARVGEADLRAREDMERMRRFLEREREREGGE